MHGAHGCDGANPVEIRYGKCNTFTDVLECKFVWRQVVVCTLIGTQPSAAHMSNVATWGGGATHSLTRLHPATPL